MAKLDIMYAPSFVRRYDKLERELQLEIKERIVLFRDSKNHQQLKVHKLKGHLTERFSFSVNYQYRILFRYKNKNIAELLTVGDHDIYK